MHVSTTMGVGKRKAAALFLFAYAFVEIFKLIFLWIVDGVGGIESSSSIYLLHLGVSILLASAVYFGIRLIAVVALVLSILIVYSRVEILLGANWTGYEKNIGNLGMTAFFLIDVLVCSVAAFLLILSFFKKTTETS